jgi:hypothetical protein
MLAKKAKKLKIKDLWIFNVTFIGGFSVIFMELKYWKPD